MENHPIPQDVTGFQFRLIGSLTVKQFAYLAVSAVGCALIYYLPISIVVKIPLFLILGGTGPALAFLPIEGRPLDKMAGHFVHALLRPNQFIYIKEGGKLPLSTIELHTVRQATQKQVEEKKTLESITAKKEEKLALYLQQIHQSSSAADKYEEAFTQNVLAGKPTQPMLTSQPQTPPATPVQQQTQPTAPMPPPQAQQPAGTTVQVTTPVPPTVQQMPVPSHNPTPEEIQQEEKEVEKELSEAKKEESQSHTPEETNAAHTKVTELDKKLQEVLAQKAMLEKELAQFRQNTAIGEEPAATPKTKLPPPAVPATPSTMPDPGEPASVKPGVRKISKDMIPSAGIPGLPDAPNLVIGIVKDPRNNVLPNILVEIMDKDGNPVRAFKTNGLGQFAAATSLPNGTYTIVFEDPKGEQQFDAVEIVAKGTVMQPIEVVSHDAREALRQQLFG